jgi:hypothetical protein
MGSHLVVDLIQRFKQLLVQGGGPFLPATKADILLLSYFGEVEKSSGRRSGYTSGCFARFPRLASHLANLATKLLLRPVLLSPLSQQRVSANQNLIPSRYY